MVHNIRKRGVFVEYYAPGSKKVPKHFYSKDYRLYHNTIDLDVIQKDVIS